MWGNCHSLGSCAVPCLPGSRQLQHHANLVGHVACHMGSTWNTCGNCWRVSAEAAALKLTAAIQVMAPATKESSTYAMLLMPAGKWSNALAGSSTLQ